MLLLLLLLFLLLFFFYVLVKTSHTENENDWHRWEKYLLLASFTSLSCTFHNSFLSYNAKHYKTQEGIKPTNRVANTTKLRS